MTTPPILSAPLGALAERLLDDDDLADTLASNGGQLCAPASLHPALIAGLARRGSASPIFVVTATALEADRLGQDLLAFCDQPDRSRTVGAPTAPIVVLRPWDTLPLERVSPDVETMGARTEVRWRMAQPEFMPHIVVTSVRAALQHLGDDDGLEPVVVRTGAQVDQEHLVERLVELGYRREHRTEARGEFSVRGGIIDLYPATAELPVRLDLFGDELERCSVFDPTDQRSRYDVDEVWCFPCREILLTESIRENARALAPEAGLGSGLLERVGDGQFVDGMEGWLPWLAPERRLVTDSLDRASAVVLIEPRKIRDRAVELNDEEAALVATLLETWNLEDLAPSTHGPAHLHADFERLLEHSSASLHSLLPVADSPTTPTVVVRQLGAVLGDDEKLADQIATLLRGGIAVTVAASTPAALERLTAVLVGQRLDPLERPIALAESGLEVVQATVSHGFIVPSAKVALITESDLTGRRVGHKAARRRPKTVEGFFDDLAIGSFVVHRQHGIARFNGVVTKTMGGATRDYLQLEFKGNDRIYLPVEQIDAVTPYSGGESPSLSKMGGADWTKTRSKARATAAAVAAELVELYRNRLTATGFAFDPDTPWQAELEASFPFIETHDQLRAIEDVKADMESERPMDRLICADVGFGKTEIAVRAVMKAVQSGKQAAVLVPTTLLASQHHQTFTERMSGFPITVALLSRFLTDAAATAVLAGLADGSIDVVVGTHRLLSPSLTFKDLGLLVVDEEQRFGVTHKEAIKHLANGVDVLTLSASPIPRTLEMALSGIRDLSMVTTPPVERRPILTYVGEYDEAAVREAIRRELLREGQVFYVHNRVADIDQVARRIREIVPEAKVAVAHGQMDEGTLEQIVQDFFDRSFDVLVCTTIVESGIDMPSVNTLICDRADLLGLGQLHQLRGRVGRGGQRAYAYLFHPADKVLSEKAYERLRTIGEHTELGSGFKIAMRDLEIRGAGNILGEQQSGDVAAIGYDLYVQLVAEAVAAAKGEPIPVPSHVKIDVPDTASLPEAYVPAEDDRLEAYRRLAATTTHDEVDDVAAEWVDRYGPIPDAATGLLDVAHLRVEALRIGIDEVLVSSQRTARGQTRSARIQPIALRASSQMKLRRVMPGSTYRETQQQLLVDIPQGVLAARFLADALAELVPVD